VEEVQNEADDSDFEPPEDMVPKTKIAARGTGIGPYATEEYREEIELGKFKNVDFKKHPEAVHEAASLIVEDMTTRFNLGLTIPPDAEPDYCS